MTKYDGQRYERPSLGKSRNKRNENKIGNIPEDDFHDDLGLGLRGKAVKPQNFEFEFEVSGNNSIASSKKSGSVTKKKSNIDGSRVLKKKPKYTVDGRFNRKRSVGMKSGSRKRPPIAETNKTKKSPLKKIRKNNPFKTDYEEVSEEDFEEEFKNDIRKSVEARYDEFEFEDQVEKLKREREELNRMSSKSSNRHLEDDEDDLKAFENYENEVKFQDNGSNINRFNSTGNHSSLALDEEHEFIEEKFDNNEDSKFYINNRGNDSSRYEENEPEDPMFRETTRLEKFTKRSKFERDQEEIE